jgi:multidrug efflux pump subunit AcrB
MGRYLIDRPIFAVVIAILVSLAGALAIVTLPVAGYPDIAPCSPPACEDAASGRASS